MEKNFACPTDVRLYERARMLLAGLAKEAGIDLRQSHARLQAIGIEMAGLAIRNATAALTVLT